MHYFWVGAIPAMLFLGVVMMPFYYGSKVRSVPEFMFRRFGTGAHLVNALSFALAQLLIAGVNLYLLGSIVHALLGWPLPVTLLVAAAIVLSYITVGGLSAAIYNEVLQFFVIVGALLPLTLIGLNRVGGWSGLKTKIAEFATSAPASAGVPTADEQLHSWPGTALTQFSSSTLSVIGIVFGLGFVLSFGYWTTNFVEVQRAWRPTRSPRPARRRSSAPSRRCSSPSSSSSGHGLGRPRPGDAEAQGGRLARRWRLGHGDLQRRAHPAHARRPAQRPARRRDRRSARGLHGRHGGEHLRLQHRLLLRHLERYVRKNHHDDYYLRIGRLATVGATVIAIFTALIASSFSNVMNYLQTLFGFFNAPLFATFILGMFWKRMTATAGWVGLSAGTLSAVAVAFLSKDAFGSASLGVIPIGGQGASFVAAATAFVVDIVLSVLVSLVTKPKPVSELRGLVYSETPREDLVDPNEKSYPWFRRTMPLAGIGLVLVVALNLVFAEPEGPAMTDHRTDPSSSSPSTGSKPRQHTAGAFDIRNIIGALIGLYGIVLTIVGLVGDPEKAKTGAMTGNANLWAGLVMLVVGVAFIAWARLKPIVVPAHDPADDAPERPTGH